MVAPVPQLEAHELINKLVDAMRSGEINEFELRQIQRRVRHLLSQHASPPHDCYMALAMVAFIDGNRQECEAAIKNALALAPKDQFIIRNAVACLGGFGSVEEAFGLISAACNLFPDDKDFLACAIMQSQHSLQLAYVGQLIEKYMKLALNDRSERSGHLLSTTLAMQGAAERHGLTDAEMLSRLKTAIQVVRDSGAEVRQTATLILKDGTFMYNLYINRDRGQCAAMNFDIADALVEQYEDTGMDVFSIVCLPREDFIETSRNNGAM